MRGLAAVLAVACGAAPAVAGQAPRALAGFPLRQADLGMAADPAAGLVLIFQPGVATAEHRGPAGPVWLRFHPDSALDWINSAASALRTPPDREAPEGIQWSRLLKSRDGRGAFMLGRARKKGALLKAHWLAVTDSARGYRLELTAAQADSLLRLVLAMAPQSGVDSTASALLEPESMTVPAAILHQPEPRSRGRLGQVVIQSVVGLDGRVEPGSSAVYLATDQDLVADALAVVRESRFRPAMRGGAPSRQYVRQVVAWRVR